MYVLFRYPDKIFRFITWDIRLIFFVLIVGINSSVSAETEVGIGMLIDGHNHKSEAFVRSFQEELVRLLTPRYQIHFEDGDVLSADWSAANGKKLYDRLLEDSRINIIVGAGVISATVLAHEKSYAKPVIALGLLDPKLQGFAPAINNRSGIHNFTYVSYNRSQLNDISHFHEIVPFSKVAVIASEEFLQLVLARERAMRLGTKTTVSLTPLPAFAAIDEALFRASAAEAAYISYLGRLSKEERRTLITTLTERGIPTFGSSLLDAELGALAVIAPEEEWTSLVRRLALNVEAILAGKDPAEFDVQISFAETFTINMQTARKIGVSPPFSVLSQASLIHEFEDDAAPVTTLLEAMQTAARASSEVIIEKSNVTLAEEDVALAKSNWRPSVNVSGNYTVIDEDTAEASYGSQAERTSAGVLSGQQIIYSDDIAASITASRHLLQSARSGLLQVQLDSIVTAAKAYLNILKTKTAIMIHRENVALTHQNLASARKREVIGYSGISDVYRWQSKLAGAQTDLFSAKNSYRLAMNELNRILNRPLQEAFVTHEPSLMDAFVNFDAVREIRQRTGSPSSLEILTLFLIDEALRNAPEVEQLGATIKARQRQLLSYKRKRYLPVISFNAQGQYIFSRDGAGTTWPEADSNDDSWNATVNLTWPLLQGGANNSNIRRMEREIVRLDAQEHRLGRLIQMDVRASLMDLTSNAVNRENSKRSSDFARKGLELVKDDYEKGRVTVVELLDAQNSALTAELTALNSEYDFLISQLVLERSIGYFTQMKSESENEAFMERLRLFFDKSPN